MIKKILFLSVAISQLTISCSKDETTPDSNNPNDQTALEKQIEEISKLPYSALPPEQQKVKLETEANEMLVTLEASQESPAIDATENLERLLNISTPDFLDNSTRRQLVEILKASDAYGIYTWDNTAGTWIKTASSSELKFIFPAKENDLTNNSNFIIKSTSSGIIIDTDDQQQLELPSSAEATLTIDGKVAATFSANAKYSNGSEIADAASYKMVVNGYTFEMSANRVPAEGKSSFTYNGKNIINFEFGSTANIDELLKDDALNKYLGTANGLITLMDNFVIVANTNIEGLANDEEAIEESVKYPQNYKSKTHYADLSNYNKVYSERMALANNNNAKLILVSKKDGTKIADVIQKSVKEYSYNTNSVWVDDQTVPVYGGYWNWDWNNPGASVDEYEVVSYLKFKDNTEVQMSVYFSTGFDNLNTKFEDFLLGFQTN